jgi:hypothetical protein
MRNRAGLREFLVQVEGVSFLWDIEQLFVEGRRYPILEAT